MDPSTRVDSIFSALENDIGFSPSSMLREVIGAAFEEAKYENSDSPVLSSPFLVTGLLAIGKTSNEKDVFPRRFYDAIGHKEADAIIDRLRHMAPLGVEEKPSISRLPASGAIMSIMRRSKKWALDPDERITPEAMMAGILEERPADCSLLFERHVDVWHTLTEAVWNSVQPLKLPPPLKESLASLRDGELRRREIEAKRVDIRWADGIHEDIRRSWEHEKEALLHQSFRLSLSVQAVVGRLFGDLLSYTSHGNLDELERSYFQESVTPRALFLATLLLGSRCSNEDLSKHAELEGILPDLGLASNQEIAELEELVKKELFREGDRTPGIVTLVSPKSHVILQKANEVASRTGEGGEVRLPHMLAALLIPEEGKRTAHRVIREDDGISLAAILEAMRREVLAETNDLPSEGRKVWGQIFMQLEAGMLNTDPNAVKSASTRTSRGGSSEFQRDGSKLGGNTPVYAKALAGTFKSSGAGDFCLAIFGPWGRGKSSLIKETVKLLEQDSKNFATVTFNAWKFPSRPEVWVYLYETIKTAASGMDFWNKLRLAVQCNLRKDKGIPLVAPGLLLMLSAIPKTKLIQATLPVGAFQGPVSATFLASPALWAPLLDGLTAILALLLLVGYGRQLWRGFGATLASYLTLPDHGGRLGLQAAIGEDLKRLIGTWTGRRAIDSTKGTTTSEIDKQSPGAPSRSKEEMHAGVITSTRQLLSTWWGFSTGCALLCLSLALIIWRVWDPATSLFLVVLVSSFLAIVIGFFALLRPVKRVEQVLLIVDDLDRCPPEEMLAVIESLRVFLDDPQISKSLKIVMLLDRDILSHAICNRYEKLLRVAAEGGLPSRFTPASIVDEQIEKYFLLTFDLPPLAPKELKIVAESIVGGTPPQEDGENSSDTEGKDNRIDRSRINEAPAPVLELGESAAKVGVELEDSPLFATRQIVRESTAQLDSAFKPSADQNKAPDHPQRELGKTGEGRSSDSTNEEEETVKELHLSPSEQKALIKLFQSLAAGGNGHVTPRRMRMTKMRYFLAREILTQLGIPYRAASLAMHLSPEETGHRSNEDMELVVGMVTGKGRQS